MAALKKYYLSLIACQERNPVEQIFFFIFVLLSFIYGTAVSVRNFLYDRRIFVVHSLPSQVISVGNLTWSGTGKTSLVMFLYEVLGRERSVAAVTKGYAADEFRLLKEKIGDVLDARDRVRLLTDAAGDYDLFILDDGFQYRRLFRDLDILLIKKDDLFRPRFLIPASEYREPLKNMRRADIIVVTYCRPDELEAARKEVSLYNDRARVFSADYLPRCIADRNGCQVDLNHFQGRRAGLLTATGYPQGVESTLAKTGLTIGKTIVYPDHHQFTVGDLKKVEASFREKGIRDVIITAKDLHHTDLSAATLDYYLLLAELKINDQDEFVSEVKKCIA